MQDALIDASIWFEMVACAMDCSKKKKICTYLVTQGFVTVKAQYGNTFEVNRYNSKQMGIQYFPWFWKTSRACIQSYQVPWIVVKWGNLFINEGATSKPIRRFSSCNHKGEQSAKIIISNDHINMQDLYCIERALKAIDEILLKKGLQQGETNCKDAKFHACMEFHRNKSFQFCLVPFLVWLLYYLE